MQKSGSILRYEYYSSVTSTNELIKARAVQGESEGLVIVADSQTGGKGRLGRQFVSQKDSGLYMTLLLRPQAKPSELMKLTAMVAYEVSCAIKRITGIQTSIKWVNDLFYDGKKICGILVESGFVGQNIDFAAVGIGINLVDNGISTLVDGAGALGCGVSVREALAKEIAEGVLEGSKRLETAYFIDEYRRQSCVIGRRISVIKNGVVTPATAEAITDDAFLCVRYDDGSAEVLSSFEISVRSI